MWYTAMLNDFTIVLIGLTMALILIPPEYPLWVKVIAILIALAVVIKMFPPLKKKE
jgi:Na+-translocating ferredoxin:NAD+ oxidoreductase RnfD subunit